MRKWLAIMGMSLALWARAEPLHLRVVAANLTSDQRQTYSPDNGNHSNPEGAGARILKALKPDVVLIQEFNTSVPARQWVNATLGESFQFVREEAVPGGIPNGVISRFPILASGAWDDPVLSNREFFWAKLALPGGRELWAVSLHLHSKNATSRDREVTALGTHLRQAVPKGALVVLGGDLNTRQADEPALKRLGEWVVVPVAPPADAFGNPATNSPRNRPYDWVLASPALHAHAVAVDMAGRVFPRGLVFDSRVFEPLDELPPVRKEDSGLPMMQHMAVVRDFRLAE